MMKEGVIQMPVQIINEKQFQEKVLSATKPVLVDFYADWCGPCKMMMPILDSLADEAGDKAVIVKINVDENQQLAQKYNVMTIPNLIVFENGKEKEAFIGVQSKDKLMKAIGLF